MAGGGSGDLPPWKAAEGGWQPPRPTISLPPRSASMESLFNGGFSPGPMTLLSNFLADGDDCKSFSQLLAGAMTSPVAGAAVLDSPGLFSPSQKTKSLSLDLMNFRIWWIPLDLMVTTIYNGHRRRKLSHIEGSGLPRNDPNLKHGMMRILSHKKNPTLVPQVQLFELEVGIHENLIREVTNDMLEIYTVKRKFDGTLDQFKTRFVAKGPYSKDEHDKNYSYLSHPLGWNFQQFDVKNTFLHGDLKKEVYMEIVPGLYSCNEKNKICKLKKALYGLKQSPRAWFGRFSQVMLSLKYKQSQGDHTLFIKHSPNGKLTLLLVYIDDMIITSDDEIEKLTLKKRNLVTWRSKKQNVVARSSAKVEFRAMTYDICEGLWMKIILDDLKVKYEESMKLFCDNNSIISITHNPIQHNRTKHIKIDIHFREVSFGMTHQQALFQVSAQANSNMPASVSPAATLTQAPADSWATMTESADHSHSEQRLQPSALNVDKPADDGYNWRKYGQKQVKGSEFPRSYYKCTHPSCPVKKKVERSLEGHVTAIIYKGEHNHQRPHPNKRSNMTSDENSNVQGNVDSTSQGTAMNSMSKMDPESSQATADRLSGTSDSEEVGDHETEVDGKNVEHESKRRKTEVVHTDPASSHRTVTEPRIIVQTTSEVDLLDDGYRWRKYGQKVVKGNPYPRSYYKCTTPGCNVRKHVERASTDPKAVITTYEGKHNHDVPAAKTNSHTMASNTASQIKSQNMNPVEHSFGNRGIGGNEQQPVARLRLKEEQIT
ncbi:putative WRKY transcription factor 3, partial [Mucuna pruriens]